MIKIDDYDITIGGSDLTFILGSCIIESLDQAFALAKKIKEVSKKNNFKFIYKASFDKANRTSISSFRGPGLDKGLEIISLIKKELNVPVLVDIHLPEEASIVAEVADIIQIPAFLCRQTDLLIAAAKTGKIVNVKKGQFLAPWDIHEVVKKIESAGNKNILLTERGVSFGYNNLVVDFISIPIMKKTGYPVVFDATHSVQLPGAKGSETGGRREFIPMLAKAAVTAGADVIFMEVHEKPDESKSDPATSFDVKYLSILTKELIALAKITRK